MSGAQFGRPASNAALLVQQDQGWALQLQQRQKLQQLQQLQQLQLLQELQSLQQAQQLVQNQIEQLTRASRLTDLGQPASSTQVLGLGDLQRLMSNPPAQLPVSQNVESSTLLSMPNLGAKDSHFPLPPNKPAAPASLRHRIYQAEGQPAQPSTRAQSGLMPPPGLTPVDDGQKSAKSEGAALRRRTLVVAKFPRCVSDVTLAQSFNTLVGEGKVVHCRIIREECGRSKCYAFIEFVDEATASRAAKACDKGELVLVDNRGVDWVVTASRAKRATAAPTKKSSVATSQDLVDNRAWNEDMHLIL